MCSFLGGSGHILPHPGLKSDLPPICAGSAAAWSWPGAKGGGGVGPTTQGHAKRGSGRSQEDTDAHVPRPCSFPGLCRAGELPWRRYRGPGAQRASERLLRPLSCRESGIQEDADPSGAGESLSPQALRSAQQVAARLPPPGARGGRAAGTRWVGPGREAGLRAGPGREAGLGDPKSQQSRTGAGPGQAEGVGSRPGRKGCAW